MAHKTLIGGTAYEISGGNTLVGGTAYSIDKGKTLVGGTAYDIPFAPSVPIITIRLGGSVEGAEDYAHIRFLGISPTVYITSDGNVREGGTEHPPFYTITDDISFEYASGAPIGCYVKSGSSFVQPSIWVNGEKVAASENGSGYKYYVYNITGNVTITLTVEGIHKLAAFGAIEIIEE